MVFHPRIVLSIAAAAEILIIGLLAVIWRVKAAEGAIPVAIIVCVWSGHFSQGPGIVSGCRELHSVF